MNYARRRNERRDVEQLLYEQHRRRIQYIQPVVDTHQCTLIKPIPRYALENQMQQRKIDVENAELLHRLTQAKTSIKTHNHVAVLRQLRLKQQLAHIKRRLRDHRIRKENEKMLSAFQSVKPTISFQALENEYQKARAGKTHVIVS
jgi:hypothetical protein